MLLSSLSPPATNRRTRVQALVAAFGVHLALGWSLIYLNQHQAPPPPTPEPLRMVHLPEPEPDLLDAPAPPPATPASQPVIPSPLPPPPPPLLPPPLVPDIHPQDLPLPKLALLPPPPLPEQQKPAPAPRPETARPVQRQAPSAETSQAVAVAPQQMPVRSDLAPSRLGPASSRALHSQTLLHEGQADVPPREIRSPLPVYPSHLRRRGQEGSVRVSLIVNEQGRVEQTQILASSDAAFERAVLRTLSGFRFKPAEQGGKPVKVRCTKLFEFRLEGS